MLKTVVKMIPMSGEQIPGTLTKTEPTVLGIRAVKHLRPIPHDGLRNRTVTSTGAIRNSRQLLAGKLASLVGLLVSRGLDKRYKEAFDQYNSRQAPKSTKKVSLVGSNQGLGIQIRF